MTHIISLIAISVVSLATCTTTFAATNYAFDNHITQPINPTTYYDTRIFADTHPLFNTSNPMPHSPTSFFDAPSVAKNSVSQGIKTKAANITLECADKVQTINAGSNAVYEFSFAPHSRDNSEWQLSLASALPGATLSNSSVSTPSNFVLTVATQEKTQYGSYTFTLTASNADIIEQTAVTLNVIPKGAQSYAYTNSTPLDIEDNSYDSAKSTIYVPHALTTFALEVDLAVRHSWRSDLEVVLTSPSGNRHVLHNRDGGSSSDINQHYKINTFNGERADGLWTLSVSDKAPGNIGTLNHWKLKIIGFAPNKAIPLYSR